MPRTKETKGRWLSRVMLTVLSAAIIAASVFIPAARAENPPMTVVYALDSANLTFRDSDAANINPQFRHLLLQALEPVLNAVRYCLRDLFRLDLKNLLKTGVLLSVRCRLFLRAARHGQKRADHEEGCKPPDVIFHSLVCLIVESTGSPFP